MDSAHAFNARRNALRSALSVRNTYHFEQRKTLILAFRRWHADAEALLTERLSASALEAMMDEAFMRYHDWLSDKHSASFKTVFNDRLDPKTIRSLLTCELSYRRVRRFHASTIRLIDAFLLVMEHDPLPYLDFRTPFSRDPSPP